MRSPSSVQCAVRASQNQVTWKDTWGKGFFRWEICMCQEGTGEMPFKCTKCGKNFSITGWMMNMRGPCMGVGLGRRGALCKGAPSDDTVQYISRILQGVTPHHVHVWRGPTLHKWKAIQVPLYKLIQRNMRGLFASRGHLSVQSSARASQDHDALHRKLRKSN